ncbi:MAG: ABC transporter ATP-binding protein [Methylophaga sp.]|nr:ABC transporter ATP-binding protein [Methylophaga sp.]
MIIVDLSQVEKHYWGVHALQQLDLQIRQGEVLGLFGHNGAGKTTAIKLILGLIKPSRGEVRVFDKDPAGSHAYQLRRQLGFLQENVSFYQQMTGLEVLNYFAKLKGCTARQSNDLLAQVGLEQAVDRRIKTYSKGMCQRLGLAQALLGSPKLLLLDEPTVGLDPLATRDFYSSIEALKQTGSTIVLCSHLLAGVEKVIDRALILREGRALAAGSLSELRQQADLPVNIELQGQDLQLPEPLAASFRRTGKGIECQISQQQKMHLLPQLLSLPGLENIDIHMPSLDDIYAHFNQHNSGTV